MDSYKQYKDKLKTLQKTYREGGTNQLPKKDYLFRSFNPQSDANSWLLPRICITAVISGVIGYILFFSTGNLIISGLTGFSLLTGGLLLIREIRTEIFARLRTQEPWNQNVFGQLFKNTKYYLLDTNDEILFVEHGTKLTGVGFFELKGIPHNINGTFERFIKMLYQSRIPLMWFYLQAPLKFITPTDRNGELFTVRIAFGTRSTLSARIGIKQKRVELIQQLKSQLRKIYGAFHQMFPHTALEPISGAELVRTYTFLVSGGADSPTL